MFLFRILFAMLWTFMTMLIAFFIYAVVFHGFDPIILPFTLVPFGTLAILTFWIKDI